MIKVKNMLRDDFSKGCKELAQLIYNDKFCPNLIIGVLTGGGYVGKDVYRNLISLTGDKEIKYVEIKIHRKGTKKKNEGKFHRLLKSLPEIICDFLRMAESLYREYRGGKEKRECQVTFDNDTDFFLKKCKQNVLIVDDAIDTGTTIEIIKDYIGRRYDASVRVAVITVTMKKPIVVPDYCLYNNRTLVRFPWSNDTKDKG